MPFHTSGVNILILSLEEKSWNRETSALYLTYHMMFLSRGLFQYVNKQNKDSRLKHFTK